jgi:ABC-type sugar transport system permease subunit
MPTPSNPPEPGGSDEAAPQPEQPEQPEPEKTPGREPEQQADQKAGQPQADQQAQEEQAEERAEQRPKAEAAMTKAAAGTATHEGESAATSGSPKAPGVGGTSASPAPAGASASRGTGTRVSLMRRRPGIAVAFLLPALVLLGALVVYPIVYSVFRSFMSADGSSFAGLDNFQEVFTDDTTLTAFRNNLIWVIVAPALCTALGLIFAVLTERVRWGTAFKLLIFMPMAISMLASGIIFRLVYEQDPGRGVANAVWTSVHDTFADTSPWPDARPRTDAPLKSSGGGAYTTKGTVDATSPASLPLVGIPPKEAADAAPAKAPEKSGANDNGAADTVTGTVWLDFVKGGRSEHGKVDQSEKALAGIKVQAVKDGRKVAEATTAEDGTFTLPAAADGARLKLPASNFAAPYNGVDWLGPTLVTPAIIGSYIWMWAGFAMVLIAAGLAGVPRELLEQARVDGANEWKVFRKITVPLLAPVLGVVTVTLMINVLKIFDLVYIISPGAVQQDANVLALQLYLKSFGGGANQGVGSAIAVILLLLVVPVMVLNIRRLRRESRR